MGKGSADKENSNVKWLLEIIIIKIMERKMKNNPNKVLDAGKYLIISGILLYDALYKPLSK
ncbi:MAG: hypothetical protein ACP6IU_14675 [Candidatus Asgardarchaeia archaeon]